MDIGNIELPMHNQILSLQLQRCIAVEMGGMEGVVPSQAGCAQQDIFGWLQLWVH